MSAYHLIIGITLIIAGLLIAWIAIAGGKETLKPNFWLGIRTAELLKSEQAWIVGHKAASRYLMIGAIGVMIFGALALFVPFDMVTVMSMSSTAWMAIFLTIGWMKASQAAKAV